MASNPGDNNYYQQQQQQQQLQVLEPPSLHDQLQGHPDTQDCSDQECSVCGMRDCPGQSESHYWHDGCMHCSFLN